MTDKYTDMSLNDFRKESGKPKEPEITTPDFVFWARNLVRQIKFGCHESEVAYNLSSIFEQGIALGKRTKGNWDITKKLEDLPESK